MYIQHGVDCIVYIRVSPIRLRIWVTGNNVTSVNTLYTFTNLKILHPAKYYMNGTFKSF